MFELYSQVGWNQIFGVRRRANQILKQLVLARLEEPRSKRQVVAEQQSVQSTPLSHPGNQYEGSTSLAALESFQQEGFPADMTVID